MKDYKNILTITIVSVLLTSANAQLAPKPPLGWNSYDCFGFDVHEDEVKENADYMATNLLEYGWEYVVIDFLWYVDGLTVAAWNDNRKEAYRDSILIDDYGRMLPRLDKFPSAIGDAGLKSLGDYVHDKGLKFGVHLMAGIPKTAYDKDTPIKGTDFTARDITDVNGRIPNWYGGMYAVDMSKDGAQEYYNSLIDLYADWGVDYIKIDGIVNPYRTDEITGYFEAAKNNDRNIVVSLSPGISGGVSRRSSHVKANSNLWRIKGDVWDRWDDIVETMPLMRNWNNHRVESSWPDADMLPLGKISIRSEALWAHDLEIRQSRFTENEQRAMMTMWNIYRSPLMFGGHLPESNDFSIRLLKNKWALHINQNTKNNQQVVNQNETLVWKAEDIENDEVFISFLNMNDDTQEVSVSYSELNVSGQYAIYDIWDGDSLGVFSEAFARDLAPHDGRLYRMVPVATDPSNPTDGIVNSVDHEAYDWIEQGPNPTSNTYSIRLNRPGVKIKKVVLSDVQGHLVHLPQYVNDKTVTLFNIENLESGIYFVDVKIIKGTTSYNIRNKVIKR